MFKSKLRQSVVQPNVKYFQVRNYYHSASKKHYLLCVDTFSQDSSGIWRLEGSQSCPGLQLHIQVNFLPHFWHYNSYSNSPNSKPILFLGLTKSQWLLFTTWYATSGCCRKLEVKTFHFSMTTSSKRTKFPGKGSKRRQNVEYLSQDGLLDMWMDLLENDVSSEDAKTFKLQVPKSPFFSKCKFDQGCKI